MGWNYTYMITVIDIHATQILQQLIITAAFHPPIDYARSIIEA